MKTTFQDILARSACVAGIATLVLFAGCGSPESDPAQGETGASDSSAFPSKQQPSRRGPCLSPHVLGLA